MEQIDLGISHNLIVLPATEQVELSDKDSDDLEITYSDELQATERLELPRNDSDELRCTGLYNLDHECPICFEELCKNNYSILEDCTHHFHEECIGEWFKKNKQALCPICNTESNNRIQLLDKGYNIIRFPNNIIYSETNKAGGHKCNNEDDNIDGNQQREREERERERRERREREERRQKTETSLSRDVSPKRSPPSKTRVYTLPVAVMDGHRDHGH